MIIYEDPAILTSETFKFLKSVLVRGRVVFHTQCFMQIISHLSHELWVKIIPQVKVLCIPQIWTLLLICSCLYHCSLWGSSDLPLTNRIRGLFIKALFIGSWFFLLRSNFYVHFSPKTTLCFGTFQVLPLLCLLSSLFQDLSLSSLSSTSKQPNVRKLK